MQIVKFSSYFLRKTHFTFDYGWLEGEGVETEPWAGGLESTRLSHTHIHTHTLTQFLW